MTHARSQDYARSPYEWVRFMTIHGTSDRIDDAADRDGLDRGEWLRRALDRALKLSEGVPNDG